VVETAEPSGEERNGTERHSQPSPAHCETPPRRRLARESLLQDGRGGTGNVVCGTPPVPPSPARQDPSIRRERTAGITVPARERQPPSARLYAQIASSLKAVHGLGAPPAIGSR
jgi:hypothetical protein